MKYLVVYSGGTGEEKTLCGDDRTAIELVESKIREGCAESDFQVYSAEPIVLQVERVPVVTLGEDLKVPGEEKSDSGQPMANDFPSSAIDDSDNDDSDKDEKSETINPFENEQVFSIDS